MFSVASVRNSEALATVSRTLNLVHQGDGVILDRDAALALIVREELVGAGSISAGTLPGLNDGWRAEIAPFDILGARTKQLQGLGLRQRLGFVFGGEGRSINQTHSGGDLQAPPPPTHTRRFTPALESPASIAAAAGTTW